MGAVLDAAEDVTGVNVSDNSSSDRALRAQENAGRDANALSKYIYEQNRADNEPWREAGVKALGGMQDADYMRDFTAADMVKDPGYDFRLSEATKALERSASAGGRAMGGRFAKELTRYSQDYASGEYDKAYDRFNADRDRRFNRLGTLAGVGQTATTQNAAGASDYASTVSNNNIGVANAQAGQAVAQANQRNQAIQQGTAAYLAFSDERLKTELGEVSKADLAEVRAALKPWAFKYKDEGFGSGEWIGVMAQDLAKTKLGKRIVIANAKGQLQVDLKKGLSLALAAIAEG